MTDTAHPNSDINAEPASTTTAAPDPAATTAAPEEDVTLEQIYATTVKDTPVQTQPVAQPQAQTVQPAAQPQAPEIKVPDPYDAEATKAFLANMARNQGALHQGLLQVAQSLNQAQVKEAAAALKGDIDNAVTAVNKVVNHPKPKVIEAMLEAEARENPTFKAIWEGRGKNPAAYNKALGVVAKKFAADLDMKVDPNLVRAQEARRLAQGQMATTAREDHSNPLEAGLAKATGDDFNRQWEQLVSGGN